MARAAFAVWNERIAPVFDVARLVRVVVAESGRIVSEKEERLPDGEGAGRALRLTELGVETLVCGAISRSVQVMIAAYGIRVVPFVAGDVRRVVGAWVSGDLEAGVFAMPGCRMAARRQGRRMHSVEREGYSMNGEAGGGQGQGGGRGRGGGQGRGAGGKGQGAAHERDSVQRAAVPKVRGGAREGLIRRREAAIAERRVRS
jgi:predicted Fe-Mo cluster-binding NifX family protein